MNDDYIAKQYEALLEKNEEQIREWTQLNNKVRKHIKGLDRDCLRNHIILTAVSVFLSFMLDMPLPGVIGAITSGIVWIGLWKEFNPLWIKQEQDIETHILECIRFREEYTELLKEYRGY